MGGFLGGFGGAAGQFGEARRNEIFQHGENAMRLAQLRQSELAQAVQQAADQYAGPEGERLRDLQMQIHTLNPGSPTHEQDIAKLTQQYIQHKAKAQQVVEQRAAQNAAQIKPVPPVQPPTAANSGVFSPFIGPGAREAVPLPGAAAQPVSNPLTSTSGMIGSGDTFTMPKGIGPIPVQGGAGAAASPFPGNQPATLPSDLARAAAAPEPVRPPVIPSIAAAPSVPPLDWQGSYDAFNSTGYMDPFIREQLKPEAALAVGQRKFPLVQKVLDELGPMTDANGLPDMGKLMRAEAQLSALGIQGQNMAPLLMQMLQPQSEPGMTEWGMLSEPDKQIFRQAHPDIDTAQFDPRMPIRKFVNKITRRTLTIEPQSQIIHYAYGPHGELIPVESRTGEALAPVQGANGGPAPVNPAFVPQTSTSILNVPGQLPQTTNVTRQRGTPSQTGGGGSTTIRPVAPSGGGGSRPSTSGVSNTSWMTDTSPIAVNYRAWVSGQTDKLDPKQQLAVETYAAQHHLPLPQMLSNAGQEAVNKVQPILDEIIVAQKLLRERKLDTMSEADSKIALGKAWAKYNYLRVKDPLTDAISDLSFDRIRSVGQALQGTGSRALPIFSLGLEHTPVIGLNSDSGQVMASKLEGMRRRAEESLASAMQMTKSGIVPPVGTSSNPSAIPSVRPNAPRDPAGILQ